MQHFLGSQERDTTPALIQHTEAEKSDAMQKPVKRIQTEKIRKTRLEAFESGKKMSQEEARAQMKRNGAQSSPNPWYRGPKKTEG